MMCRLPHLHFALALMMACSTGADPLPGLEEFICLRDQLTCEGNVSMRCNSRGTAWAEQLTCEGSSLRLQIAADYSSRDQIMRAVRSSDKHALEPESFGCLLDGFSENDGATCDVDLLIRTGGEQRLSDFMLWECAYAELLFVDKFWPDFAEEDLRSALKEYARRDRRFGRLSAAVTPELTAEQS